MDFTSGYQDLLGNSKAGFTIVYWLASHAVLEASPGKLIERIAQWSSSSKGLARIVAHLWLIDVST